MWLCKLNEKNMVRPSFVPAEPVRQVRDWTRDRFDLVADRTRVRQRVEKLLEDALLKMSVVITDIFGVSGRAIMAALTGGQRDPAALVTLAVPQIIKNKRAALEQALTGRFTDHHADRLEMLLTQHDQLTALIDQVTTRIDQAITALPPVPDADPAGGPAAPGGQPTSAPDTAAGDDAYLSAIQRLCEIPGIGPDVARSIIGEIGLDVTGVFGTAQRLCSWAKVSPRTVQSGATKRSGKTGKGNFYLKSGLGQVATGAAKTDTFLGERYRRLVKRMPKAKAKPRSPAPSWSSSSNYWPTPPNATKTSAPATTPSAWTPSAAPANSPPNCTPSAGRSPSPRSQPDTRQSTASSRLHPLPAKKPGSAPQRRQPHIPPQTPNRRSPAWVRCRLPTQDRYFPVRCRGEDVQELPHGTRQVRCRRFQAAPHIDDDLVEAARL